MKYVEQDGYDDNKVADFLLYEKPFESNGEVLEGVAPLMMEMLEVATGKTVVFNYNYWFQEEYFDNEYQKIGYTLQPYLYLDHFCDCNREIQFDNPDVLDCSSVCGDGMTYRILRAWHPDYPDMPLIKNERPNE